MKRVGIILGTLIVVFLILMISGAFYTVREWEQVVITQFGKPIGNTKTEAGLYFKIPLIQELHRFEKRIMRWDGDPKEIPTRDKRFIWVDTTARWRISDSLKFLQVLGDYPQAYAKLDDIILTRHNGERSCHLLLTQGNLSRSDQEQGHWATIWEGGRRGEKEERYYLYQRQN